MKNKLIILAVFLVLASATIGYFLWKFDVDASGFSGSVVSYELDEETGNLVLTVSGAYISDTESYSPSRPIEIAVVLTPGTPIQRLAMTRPTNEQLQATNGYFNTADLPSEQGRAIITDIIEDFGAATSAISFKAEADHDVYGKKQFTAINFDYNVLK